MDAVQDIELLRLRALAKAKRDREARARQKSQDDKPASPYGNKVGPIIAAGDSAFGALPILGSYQDKIQSLLIGEPEEEIKADRLANQKLHPVASGIGSGVGFLGSLAIPLGKAFTAESKGAQVLSKLGLTPQAAARLLRIGQGAASGGIIAGASNAPSMNMRAGNAIFGAATGGLLTGGLEGVQGILGGKTAAARQMFNSLRPTAADESANIFDRGIGIGKTLLDKEIPGGFLPPSRETMFSRIGNPGAPAEAGKLEIPSTGQLKQVGQSIGNIVAGVDKASGGGPIIDRLETRIKSSGSRALNLNPRDRITSGISDDVKKELESMFEAGSMTATDANKLKTTLQDRIRKFSRDAQLQNSITGRADIAERDALSQQLEDAVSKYSPQEATAYIKDKDSYGNLRSAHEILKETIGRDRSKPFFNKFGGIIPGVSVMGMAGLVGQIPSAPEKTFLNGAILGGLLTAGNVARNYGPQSAARFLNLDKNPIATSANAQSIWQYIQDKNRSEQ